MFIKTITIQGFKSYRDQVAVDPFSPGHNVVVGRNGSGKSNFFMAIRFVLSDAHATLTREERQRLLHEGTSTQTTLSAFVEIVFDNSDGRFPTSGDEVYLRRSIGLKKDDYSLDKKSATKAEVMNLLESAGFSRSNPYYIVPQGRITGLTNMSDKERLNLLKEVAGTKVYEQKRAESSKIMEDTDAKRTKISDLLTYIEDRLNELEEEKEELKEFQEKDRDRRCLEYALHHRELEDVSAALEKVEADRQTDIHSSNEMRKAFNDQERIIQEHEEALTTAKHSLSTTSLALRQFESEMADLVRARTEIECTISDFTQAGQVGEARRKEVAKEVTNLERRIEEASAKLDSLGPELEERLAEEREAKEALDATRSSLNVLLDKQGRAQQFRTQAERDTYLTSEIKSLKSYEKTQQKRIDDLKKDVESAKSHLEEVVARSAEHQKNEEERRQTLKSLSEEVTGLKANVDGMQEQRKDLWREDGKLSQGVSLAKTEMQAAQRGLQGMMDKDTSNGLRSLNRIAKQLKLDGVYGPLYELFEVSDRFKTAVEVTAGNSKLVEAMTREKCGRLTFMPLNRLKSTTVQYPKANDAIPMISKLTFDRAYVMAFEHVFGRTIICDELSTAAQYSRSLGLNAVTVEGDRVDRKGSLTGGYHDVRRSRLDTIKLLKKWQNSYNTDSSRHAEVKKEISRLEQQITTSLGQVQKLEAQRKQILEGRSQVAAQANYGLREEEEAKQRAGRLEYALEEAEGELRDASKKRGAYEEELKTPLRQKLTDEEIKRMDQLTKDVEGQKKEADMAVEARRKISSERSRLEIELSENFRRRREELRAKLDDLEGDAGSGINQSGEIELKNKELKNTTESIDDLAQQIGKSEETLETLNAEITSISAQLEEIQNEQLQNTRAIMKVQKNAERYLTKRQTLVSRKDECGNAIRDLGVLPEEAFTKYLHTQVDKLVKKLHKINDGLKKFAHVNKKAFEQYNNFTKQRDELLKRREELDNSASSIEELIETLDQRKDEAIERTFKQVSAYFEEVFERLVPAGRGQLVIQKKIDSYQDEETEEPENAEKSSIDNYTGVSIKVSFNSKADEGQRIQQLSGGQKSLVALATVFAIQKCDPAPFYLFDEIDANLDAQYRTAVAAMIHDLSKSAQFITTTFRSEMLLQADKYYGVFFDKQKVSSIKTIEREEAYHFIEHSA